MRVLFITSTPPVPTWGGAMAFYRHFCERSDFTVNVITDNTQVLDYDLPYDYSLISHGNLWQRIACTRLTLTAHTWGHLVTPHTVHPAIMRQALDFDPDAVFTVAGSWSWMANLAKKVASQLSIPLVGSFNDWWYYNSIRHTWLDSLLEWNFKRFYRKCDLAFCTSEGMRSALGPHSNAVVLYPTGAAANKLPDVATSVKKPFTLAFGGNLGDWYGLMIEDLITQAADTDVHFKLFGSNPSWSESFDNSVKTSGMYHGQIPFEQLRAEMAQSDALLLLMGFDDSCALIERTSFKTKFLDYLSFQKPILLWGPDYCSAVQIAQEFDSAEICTSPAASDFLQTILKLREQPERQQELLDNAQYMYQERFHPDKIHQVFCSNFKALVA